MFSCGITENIYLLLLRKPLAMNCEGRGSFVWDKKAGSGKTFPVIRLSIPTWLIQNLWVMPKFCCPKDPTIKPGNFSKALYKWEIIHCCFMWSLQPDFITRLVWIFLGLHQHFYSFRWCRVMSVSEFKSIYQWCTPSSTFKSHDICREINHPFFLRFVALTLYF